MVDKNEIASNAAESTNALNPLLGGINRQELLGAVAMMLRSSSADIPACVSQRQPWQETSWPRATASLISQGVACAARPHVEKVAKASCNASASTIR